MLFSCCVVSNTNIPLSLSTHTHTSHPPTPSPTHTLSGRYDALFAYGEGGGQGAVAEDMNLVPVVVSTVIVPSLSQFAQRCWDPAKLHQTTWLVASANESIMYITDTEAVPKGDEALSAFTEAVLGKLRVAVEESWLPLLDMHPPHAAARSMLRRQLRSLAKLLSAVAQFHACFRSQQAESGRVVPPLAAAIATLEDMSIRLLADLHLPALQHYSTQARVQLAKLAARRMGGAGGNGGSSNGGGGHGTSVEARTARAGGDVAAILIEALQVGEKGNNGGESGHTALSAPGSALAMLRVAAPPSSQSSFHSDGIGDVYTMAGGAAKGATGTTGADGADGSGNGTGRTAQEKLFLLRSLAHGASQVADLLSQIGKDLGGGGEGGEGGEGSMAAGRRGEYIGLIASELEKTSSTAHGMGPW